jgi:hypothetical protein
LKPCRTASASLAEETAVRMRATSGISGFSVISRLIESGSTRLPLA